MNFNEVFKVTSTDKGYMITSGVHMVMEDFFETEEEAQKRIDEKDWNCIAFLAYSIANLKVMEKENKFNENDKIFIEEEDGTKC